MITLGGNAELELVDSLDPFSEGIIFSVMPPKKSWKNISNLSGGEKTLSSLALVFALHVFKVRPDYFILLVVKLTLRPRAAHTAVLYGRDRRRARLPQRFHCCQLRESIASTLLQPRLSISDSLRFAIGPSTPSLWSSR